MSSAAASGAVKLQHAEHAGPVPTGSVPDGVRHKDRLSYRHQLIQVDLTYVKSKVSRVEVRRRSVPTLALPLAYSSRT
jgi:hypothetical protein